MYVLLSINAHDLEGKLLWFSLCMTLRLNLILKVDDAYLCQMLSEVGLFENIYHVLVCSVSYNQDMTVTASSHHWL